MKSTRRPQGFSLLEMTIVLIIVSLLLGGLFMPLAARQDAQRRADAERQLAEIRDALIGYAQLNGRLPCPARSASDGRENRDAVTLQCATLFGFVPGAELGVMTIDPWNHLLRYRVSGDYAHSGSAGSYPTLNTASAAQLKIQGHLPDGSFLNLTNEAPREVVFVLVSHGKNGYHGTLADGSPVPADTGANNDDEDRNRDALSLSASTSLISRSPTPGDAANLGEFDDLVVWAPRSLLASRLTGAGWNIKSGS